MEIWHQRFRDWYAEPTEFERWAREQPVEGVNLRRAQFGYYKMLRDDGIDEAYAFVASQDPIVKPPDWPEP